MIDHLVKFDDLPDPSQFGLSFGDDAPSFNWQAGTPAISANYDGENIDICAIEIIIADAKYDAHGDIKTAKITADGYWANLRYHRPIIEWQQNPHLIAITDADLASQDKPFVIWKNAHVPWDAMQGKIWPTFAGSHSPFGEHMNETKLISVA